MTLDLYFGCDESNNGRPLEIHTGVFSVHASDAKIVPILLPKFRSHKNLFKRLRNRTYSFLLFTDTDRVNIPKQERLGTIVSSLLYEEFDWAEFDSFNFLLDGDRSKKEIEYLVNIVTDKIPAIKPDKMSVSWGGKFDQKYLVVNLADELAHYLYRRGVDAISEHRDRKVLIY